MQLCCHQPHCLNRCHAYCHTITILNGTHRIHCLRDNFSVWIIVPSFQVQVQSDHKSCLKFCLTGTTSRMFESINSRSQRRHWHHWCDPSMWWWEYKSSQSDPLGLYTLIWKLWLMFISEKNGTFGTQWQSLISTPWPDNKDNGKDN